MTDHLLALNETVLHELVGALRAGRLIAPFSTLAVTRYIHASKATQVAEELQNLCEQGFDGARLCILIDALIRDRELREHLWPSVDVVTTGPEVVGVANRDTAVVVRELFAHASSSVLIAGFAVYQGKRLFQNLAQRMADVPELDVCLFLDIQRPHSDTTASSQLIKRFAERFRSQQWPADRPLPKVYFDPRSLATDKVERACLHAKCVVIDKREAFVTSANFTEAAQERNIEVGLLVSSSDVADKVTRYFRGLLDNGFLEQVF